jgi:MFS family permease
MESPAIGGIAHVEVRPGRAETDPTVVVVPFRLGLGWNVSYVAATAELVTHASPVERGRLMGAVDLGAGLLGASLALLGGAAYTEWGAAAVAVGGTVAVVLPAIAILVGRRAPAVAPEPAG